MLGSLGFFGIELLIRLGKQLFDALAIAAVHRNPDACGKPRRLVIVGHHLANAVDDTMGFVFLRFWKDQCKLVSAIARRGVNGAAVNAQNIGDAADGAAADKVAVTVIDGLQTVEVQEQYGKGRPERSVRSVSFSRTSSRRR